MEIRKLFDRLLSFFGRFLNKEAYDALAQFELYEINIHVLPLYIENMKENLDELIEHDRKRFAGIDDLFLWGILREFLKDRPSLPTQPVDRLKLHLLSYLMQYENLPFDGAKKRLHEAEMLVSQRRNQIWQEMVNRGGTAWRDKSTGHHLKASYKLAQTLVSRVQKE